MNEEVERGIVNAEAVILTVMTLGPGMKISKDLAECAKDAWDAFPAIRRAVGAVKKEGGEK